jgi:hypothetical protein
MTIEAKLDRLIELHERLLAKFEHIGNVAPSVPTTAPAPSAPASKQSKPTPPAAAAPSTDTSVPYDKVKAEVQGKVAAGKRAAVVAVLTEFGVKSAQELPPAKYAEALAKLQAL